MHKTLQSSLINNIYTFPLRHATTVTETIRSVCSALNGCFLCCSGPEISLMFKKCWNVFVANMSCKQWQHDRFVCFRQFSFLKCSILTFPETDSASQDILVLAGRESAAFLIHIGGCWTQNHTGGLVPTGTPTSRCSARLPLHPRTATSPCLRARRSGCSGPPVPSFPACPACRRRSGRRSACRPSCGWCFCGSSSAGRGSASHSSSLACSCTDPSVWPPVNKKQGVQVIWYNCALKGSACLETVKSFQVITNYEFSK